MVLISDLKIIFNPHIIVPISRRLRMQVALVSYFDCSELWLWTNISSQISTCLTSIVMEISFGWLLYLYRGFSPYAFPSFSNSS